VRLLLLATAAASGMPPAPLPGARCARARKQEARREGTDRASPRGLACAAPIHVAWGLGLWTAPVSTASGAGGGSR
jgi:hypothetical protein